MLYRICTHLYWPVSACICMYHKLTDAVSSAYMYVYWIHSAHIYTDMHSWGEFISAYVSDCILLRFWIHANMHSCCVLHSINICMYVYILILNTCRYAFLILNTSAFSAYLYVSVYIKLVYFILDKCTCASASVNRIRVFIAPYRPPAGTGKSVGGCAGCRQWTGRQARGANSRLGWPDRSHLVLKGTRGASNKTAHCEEREVAARSTDSGWALT